METNDPRVQRSRQALLDAGIEVFGRNSNASLTDVAAEAGVGRATLYRHFESREQLILELALQSVEETDHACEHVKTANLRGRVAIEETIRSVMPLADRFHFLLSLWNVVGNDPSLEEVYARQLSELGELIFEAKSDGDINADLPDHWLIALLDSLFSSAWYCIGEKILDVDQAAQLSISAFFDGVGTKD